MDLRDYFHTISKRWRVVAAATLIGLAAAAAVTLSSPKIYSASSQLFVSVQTTTPDVAAANQGNLFTQQRVTSYAEIVDSPLLLEPVAAQLGLSGEDAAALKDGVSADAPLDTTLINVSVSNRSAEQAARIANAVSTRFATVITELEQGEGADQSLVKVTVVRQAEVPDAPVSPRPKLNLALGLLLGLALGAGLAVLRETVDTSVKSPEDVESVASDGDAISVIGGIAFDRNSTDNPLIVQDDPHSPRAEAFRQLRTNLQFVDVDNPPRSIVVTSSVPNEGKSTTAANLAITMAQAGVRVALVEADLRRPKVSSYLGLDNAAGLTTALIGRAATTDLLQPWGNQPLKVLPSGPTAPNPSELLGSHQMLTLIRELENDFDLVVIDAPPLLPVTDAAVLAALAGGAIVVVRSGRTSKEQLRRAVENLRAVDARVLGAVLNMVNVKSGRYDYYDYGSYAPQAATAPKASAGRGRRGR